MKFHTTTLRDAEAIAVANVEADTWMQAVEITMRGMTLSGWLQVRVKDGHGNSWMTNVLVVNNSVTASRKDQG